MTSAIGFGDFLYGYVNGERVMVANTTEQIAAFIMKHRMGSVKLVNLLDVTEIETSMGLIMYCSDQSFLQNELLPVLIPMQRGEVEAPEFVPYVNEEFLIRNVRMQMEEPDEGYYLANLDFGEGYCEIIKISEVFKTEKELIERYPDSISVDEAAKISEEKELI